MIEQGALTCPKSMGPIVSNYDVEYDVTLTDACGHNLSRHALVVRCCSSDSPLLCPGCE